MTKKNKRSYQFLIKPITFLVGLFITTWLVLWIETVRPSDFGFYKDIFKREEVIKKRENYPLKKTGAPLTKAEIEMGRIAWKYFENNYQPQTGFVNSVDRYTSTTFWDLSSSLMATMSAYEIGVLDSAKMDIRIKKLFQSLLKLRLYENLLPNKVYNTITLSMTMYDNSPTEKGVGWSSMDIGKFLTVCNRLIHNYPEYTRMVNEVLHNWKFNAAIENATLYGIGGSFKDRRDLKVQEGKLGYEEYCAKGFDQMGYDVSNSLGYDDFIKFVQVYNQEIGVDSREVKVHSGYNYVVSEPYILDGLEYGFDINSRELGYRVYDVQKENYKKTGKYTAVSETHIDQPPHFIYNSIYADGEKWKCVAENGEDAEMFKTLSTSTAIAWYYLYDDFYSLLLFTKVKNLYHPKLGWYSGRYEKTGKINKAITANVNAIVLEALNYKIKGALIKN